MCFAVDRLQQAGSAAAPIPDAQRLRLSQLAVPIVLQVPSFSAADKVQPQPYVAEARRSLRPGVPGAGQAVLQNHGFRTAPQRWESRV